MDISYLNAVVPDDTPYLSMEQIEQINKDRAQKKSIIISPPTPTLSTATTTTSFHISKSDNCLSENNSSIISIDGSPRRLITNNSPRDFQRRISLDASLLSANNTAGAMNAKTRRISAGNKPMSRYLTIPVKQSIQDDIQEEEDLGDLNHNDDGDVKIS